MRRRLASTVLAIAACVGLTVAVSPSAAHAGEDWNEYSLVGLPAFVTGPTTFSVVVDGPYAICSAEYRDQTVSSAPWTFTYEPNEDGDHSIRMNYCDRELGRDYVGANVVVPFEFPTKVLSANPYVYDGMWRSSRRPIELVNYMDTPAQVVVTDRQGRVVATGVVPGGQDQSASSAPPSVKIPIKGIKTTTTYTVTMTGVGGISMSSPLILSRGWAPYERTELFAEPCATVQWSYSTKGQPRADNTMRKDVLGALARLSKVTGLKFEEVRASAEEESAQVIRFSWDDLGEYGPAGMGGTNGSVTFNNKDYWPRNVNAGFGKGHGVSSGRGWLVIHETMHVLGFDHINDKTQVMNPIGYMHEFGKGDLQGLRALYPKTGCNK